MNVRCISGSTPLDAEFVGSSATVFRLLRADKVMDLFEPVLVCADVYLVFRAVWRRPSIHSPVSALFLWVISGILDRAIIEVVLTRYD
jgi:hypothetical protein